MDELQSGTVVRSYTYGLDLISQKLTANSQQRFFYSYDGHGSVRQLTNSAGNLTDSYTYDAFGNLIEQTGTTPNLYLYAGEQFDPDLGLYYNRARYLDVRNGRFLGMDGVDGLAGDPPTLHRYLYARANPIAYVDTSGNFPNTTSLSAVGSTLVTIAATAMPYFRAIQGWFYINAYRIPAVIDKIDDALNVAEGSAQLLNGAAGLVMRLIESDQVYSAGNSPRGHAMGDNAQQNLDRFYPVIDNWEPVSGEATSLYSTTRVENVDAFISSVSGKADELGRFEGASGFNRDRTQRVIITPDMTRRRILIVGIPFAPLNWSPSAAQARIRQLETRNRSRLIVLPLRGLGRPR